MDYQKTLNLPKTDFSMKAGLAQKEPVLLAKWKSDDLYGKIRAKSKGKKSFILHDGPPYANGNIHIGHALNKTLKDIIVKYKTMKGFDSLYVPGWDCHGLPIEHQLLKELKTNKSNVDCLEFRKKAHDYAMKYVGIQREEFKRLGIFGEWEDPYLTLTPSYEFWILKSLAELTKKGYVYRRLKPVNWCFSCETALAEAEVEYEDHTSPTVYVKFKVNNPEMISGLPKDKNLFLLIWTTTPWTLLANVAVAAHPKYQYVFAQVNDDILILEESLAEKVLASLAYKILKKVQGSELQSLVYTHPFGARENCPVVNVEYVTREDGTGLVHTAPGHGQEDYETGLKYKLEVLMPVNARGVFTEDGKPFTGEHVFKANPKIIEHLQSQGMLFKNENIAHSYPHCWRCKNPIIFRATEQWFMKIDHNGLRGKLQQTIENDVEWIPPAGKERIGAMVSTRPDWCLSRQRYWGVPIPALACVGCKGEHKLFPEVIEHLASIVKTQGSDVWFEKDLKELLPKNFSCPDCHGTQFEKTHDILDVWFDSGVSNQAVFNEMLKMPLPADLYLEGSDQHRGWFQSSLIPSVALTGRAPYRGVLTHGFVVDGQGRKMSKSLGNVMAPQQMIDSNGADILRWWVASSSYHDDIRISKEIMERLVDSYRKIRNTIRYLLGNLDGFNPKTDTVEYSKMLEIDRWALYQLSRTLAEVNAGYDEFDFVKVTKAIYVFCNEDLSSIYLDILKDRLYTCRAQSAERRSAQTVLYYILNSLVRILAPILVFTAEEVYSMMTKSDNASDNVHLLDWPVASDEWKTKDVHEKFKTLMELRPFVLKALEETRQAGSIGASLEAQVIIETASDRDHQYLSQFQGSLATFFIVSQSSVQKVNQVASGLNEVFSKTRIVIKKAEGIKCARCWNYRTDVGQVSEHPTICSRCVQAV